MNYSYEQVDLATRDFELDRLRGQYQALCDRWHEIASEIGTCAGQLVWDRDAGDLTASLAHLALKMAELSRVVDDVRIVENELRELSHDLVTQA